MVAVGFCGSSCGGCSCFVCCALRFFALFDVQETRCDFLREGHGSRGEVADGAVERRGKTRRASCVVVVGVERNALLCGGIILSLKNFTIVEYRRSWARRKKT